MSFTIVIYASNEVSFLSLKKKLEVLRIDSILWCNAKTHSRAQVINQNLNKWLLFLDHDCELNRETQIIIQALTATNPEDSCVYAGLYANGARSSYLQKVHNFIANTWLMQSYERSLQNKLVLGGVFLVYGKTTLKATDEKLFWGAEDKVLSYELAQAGFKISLINNFQVMHLTSNSIKHFLRRAYLHGKNDIKYILKDNNKISYLFWIRKIGFANLNLLPLIVCHFCIQRLAELIQRVRH